MNRLFKLLFIFHTQICLSQLPDTDIWLFKVSENKDHKLILKDPLNFTNREGYDNQPSFSADGKKIYFTSIYDKQADLYVYDLKKKKSAQLTKTNESEYSPVLTFDTKHLTSVVVEKDSAQRIHFIDATSGNLSSRLEFDSVGYYNFINSDTLVYYKLTEPHSLRFYVLSSGEDRFLCASPIRSVKTINRHSFLFGIKDSVKVNFYIYDFLLRKAEFYTSYPSVNEDCIWHPQWGLIKSEEKKLLQFNPKTKSWNELFDLTHFGINKIARFIFDPKNKLLVVVDNKK